MIEAAIVLGIVGLVIGGIWVAAAAVGERNKINRSVEAILLLKTQAQNLYNGRGMPAPNSTLNITAPIVASVQGLSDLKQGGNILTPWSGGYFQVYFNTWGSENLMVTVHDLPAQRCAAVIRNMIARAGKDLLSVYINPSYAWDPPFDATAISCPDPPATTQFHFSARN